MVLKKREGREKRVGGEPFPIIPSIPIFLNLIILKYLVWKPVNAGI